MDITILPDPKATKLLQGCSLGSTYDIIARRQVPTVHTLSTCYPAAAPTLDRLLEEFYYVDPFHRLPRA